MTRFLNLAAGQLGPIARNEPRSSVVKRLIALLHEAKSRGCELVVFPEMALTTFFPRWYISDWAEVDRFFEPSMPSAETQPLFDATGQLLQRLSLLDPPSEVAEQPAQLDRERLACPPARGRIEHRERGGHRVERVAVGREDGPRLLVRVVEQHGSGS